MTSKFLPFALMSIALIEPLLSQNAAGMKAEIRLLAFSQDIQPTEVFMRDPAAPADAPSVKVKIQTYLNEDYYPMDLRSRKVAFTTKPDYASLAREGELLAEVTIPPAGDSVILIFLPNKMPRANFQIMPISDSKKIFPAGSFNITNISPFPVRLMLEDKNFDFKPGQPILIQNPPVRPSGQVGMRAFAFRDEKWNPISTGLWPHPGNARGVMILFQDPKSKEVQLQAFDDVPPRVAKPSSAAAP